MFVAVPVGGRAWAVSLVPRLGERCGDDRSRQGRAQPGEHNEVLLPPCRGRRGASVRRGVAYRRRQGCGGAEFDAGNVARRIRNEVAEVFGRPSEVSVLAPGGLRKNSRYIVRVAKGGDDLARQTGLIDMHGRPVRGLPPQIVSAGVCCATAAWRGAFLAHGSLTEPGRSSALEVTCPGPEAALALVGSARRMGVATKAREVRGIDRVVIRDGEAIGALLTRIGAHSSVLAWEERRMRREVRATANRLANFDDANLRRSIRAAVAAGARVERAMELLPDDSPDHLLSAGRLRLEHRQASLEESVPWPTRR